MIIVETSDPNDSRQDVTLPTGPFNLVLSVEDGFVSADGWGEPLCRGLVEYLHDSDGLRCFLEGDPGEFGKDLVDRSEGGLSFEAYCRVAVEWDHERDEFGEYGEPFLVGSVLAIHTFYPETE